MLFTADSARLRLADDEVARLRDACDSRLEVTDGVVWLTVEGDREDIVLHAGQAWVVDTAATVTVSALRGTAALDVRARAGGRACRVDARRAPRSRWDAVLASVSLSADAVA